MLSGTPIHNHLNDLWSLFDYVTRGSLLGTIRVFNDQFGKTIAKGSLKNTSDRDKSRAVILSQRLMELISPHFLRRMTDEVLPKGKKITDVISNESNLNDLVVW